MTFKEKIDNLLRISGKKFNSVYDLEQKSGVGMGTIRKAYDENREPSKRIIWKFLETLSINTEWWETGKGEIYLINGTHEQKPMDNAENDNGTVQKKDIGELGLYRKIFDGETDFYFLPRKLMEDTQIVSKGELERKDKMIMFLIKRLGIELSEVPGFEDDKQKA